MTGTDRRPLIAHVIYRFAVGGLENGVVNLLNNLPRDGYRHALISLTDITEFSARLSNPEVGLYALHKPEGQTWRVFPEVYRLLRTLRPAILHSRNLAALETSVPAWAAGVPVRIHGEHGFLDLDHRRVSMKSRMLRRIYRPWVDHYVAVSASLAGFLQTGVGVPATRISQIYNGVDTERFAPVGARASDSPFDSDSHFVIGTVGRMQAVKDQLTLVRAFIQLAKLRPRGLSRMRLVLVGDGPLRSEAQRLLHEAGLNELAWLPGERSDIAALMRGMSLFVLPSRGEGISNTILEAMASGLPVVATSVGGNAELIDDGVNGALVAPEEPQAMALRLAEYVDSPRLVESHGSAAREKVEARFSLARMMAAYDQLYRRMLARTADSLTNQREAA